MNESEQGRATPPIARQSFLPFRIADSLVTHLAQGRIYYGWYIVAAVFVVEITTVGFNGPFFSLFLKPMSKEFGWTRAMTTGAVTVGTLAAASIGFLMGWVLDRYGPRWMIAGAGVLMGASYIGLSQVNSLLAFYLVYAVGRSMMQSPLGRSMLNALTAKWFVRRRAIAIAFSTLGGIVGGTIMAPVAQWIINSYGWREAWAFFGLLALSIVVLPWLLLRRLPEDLGLLPDGDGRGQADQVVSKPARSGPEVTGKAGRALVSLFRRSSATMKESNLTLGEATREVSFWVLCLLVGVNMLSTTGVTFHMVPHFTDVGIPTAVGAATVSVFIMFQAPSVFLWGFLADRLGGKRALMGVLWTLALGTLLVARAHSPLGAYLGAGVFGAGMGGYMLVTDVVWADFFGRRHLGSIRGASMVFQLVGNASGSLIAALLYDLQGNYDFAFKLIMVVLVMSSMVLLLARKPQPKTV